jgi:hypothetical protein|tara:strand:+ start:591 stop:1391 length:801 start_codon:yes stop_codon:yes gene_type:complete
MKKLICLFALAALNSQADVVKNYSWLGNVYEASSTNVVAKTISPLRDDVIQFDLISSDCLWGVGGGGHADDCDKNYTVDHPGDVFRSQIRLEKPFKQNVDREFSFSFKDISEDDGLGYKAIGITIFELYPKWIASDPLGQGPTHHIWYDPKSKNIFADSNWQIYKCGACNNIPGHILSKMTDGWNTFVIQTNQTSKDNGYLKIIHNGNVIVDLKGKTSYDAPQGYQAWWGAYVCCSFTKKGEPNHRFLFKDILSFHQKPYQPKISL